MVSEINNLSSGQVTSVDKKPTQVNPSEKIAAAVAPKASSETVTLTDIAARVQELSKSVESLPVSDAEKVARLRDEITAGTYQVDAEAVAEKFNAIEQILDAAAAKS